ncbi:MAG: hypothetical protein ACJA0Q_000767 [Saprospiraceae bacterium]|jgi:hypothetical protein
MKILLPFFVFLFAISSQLYGQACASTSIYPYEWPSHRNWFMAAGNGWTGTIVNMQTMATTQAGATGAGDNLGGGVSQYEGTAIVSDDNGNLLMYTNGRRMWTGTLPAIRTYDGLLEGNEGGSTGSNGSASQGIISFRHPTAPNDIHVFTTDDAESGGTVGLNHFVFDLSGNLTAGPIRLGTFRSSEALAATRHSNGIDFWVTAMDNNGNFHAYLLTCTGIDIPNSNLSQAGGPDLSSNSQLERGGLAFSYDSQKMAQAHGSLIVSEKVSLYDFDNTTGAITNRMNICQAGQSFGPYDIIFSPDNNRLFVNFLGVGATLDYYDISSGVAATITASRASTGIAASVPTGRSAAIQMGAKGLLYMASGAAAIGPLREIQEDINTATSFTTVDIPGANGSLGLPRMFIPPLDNLEIQDPGVLCTVAPAVDLSTSWVCAGGNAELLGGTYTSLKGGITDPDSGIYDPSIVGVATDTVIFTLTGSCGLVDTLIISVIDCACNDTTLAATPDAMCENATSLDLTTLVVTSESGTWSLTGVPAGSSSTPLTGTVFDPNGSDPGTYTVKYTLDDAGSPGCPDGAERSITIQSSAVSLGNDTTICSSSPDVQVNPSVTDAGAAWSSVPTGLVNTTGLVDIAGVFAAGGTVTITYDGGCLTPDSKIITINSSVTDIGAATLTACSDDPALQLSASATDAGAVWSSVPIGFVDATGLVDIAGAFASVGDAGTVTVSYGGGCLTPDNVVITINVCCAPVDVNTPTAICVGETTDLSTSISTGTGTWAITGTDPGGATLDPNTGVFTASNSISGTYEITFTTDVVGCSNDDVINLTVNPYPIAVVSPSTGSVCNGQSVELSATSGIGTSFTYLWQDASTNDRYNVNAPGDYWVIMSVGSCSDTDSVTIGSTPSPVISLPANDSICTLRDSTLAVVVTHNADVSGTVTWNTIGSENDLDVIVIETPTTLIVTVTDADGCIGIDTMEVTEYCAPPIIGTVNVFVPGGTDNPTWTPTGIYTPADIGESYFEVYNRWGLKMYETAELVPKWDGTNDGTACATGVYFWIWKYTEVLKDEKHNLNGYVQLLQKK